MTTGTSPAVHRVLLALDAAHAAAGQWDTRPAVWLAYESDSTKAIELPVPDEQWANQQPVDVLHRLAAVLAADPWLVAAAPGPALAFVFACETWASTDSAAQAWAAKQRLYRYPGRQEAFMLTAVDRDGGRYMTVRTRSGQVYTPPVAAPTGGPTGRIFDALTLLQPTLQQQHEKGSR